MGLHEAECAANLFRRIVDSLPYYNAAARSAEIAKYSAANLRNYCVEDQDSVLFVRDEQDIVGICISRLDDSIVWLLWFVVDERYRRMNVGGSPPLSMP
jgi:hypothetical protein